MEYVSDKMEQPRPGQWHRPYQQIPLAETANNIVQCKPPIPATSQAKSKLKAFQFEDGVLGRDQSSHVGIENTCEASAIEVHNNSAPDDAMSADRRELCTTDADERPMSAYEFQHVPTFPCTPGTRLPLEDLIGNFEENAKKDSHNDRSPEEHIGWIPNSSSALLTPNRKRKRAKSSSPSCPNTSSQRNEASAFFQGSAVEGEKNTPEADPAADLWQRYATGKRADGDSKAPEVAQLMFQISPRAFETPAAKNAGLRRWASTGNDWPSSKSKGRRTTGKTSIALIQEEQSTDAAGKSKVATMVDRLQESLATQKLTNPFPKPTVRIEGPSSSSPLPEVTTTDCPGGGPSASPLEAKRPVFPRNKVKQEEPRTNAHSIANPGRNAIAQNDDPQLNFKRDNDKILLAPDSLMSAPLQLQSKAPLPAYKRPSINRTSSVNEQQNHPASVQPPAPVTLGTELDEFGDDLNLSAEDLEELMTQPPPLHKRPLHQIPPHPNPPPQQNLLLEQQQSTEHIDRAAGRADQPICVDEFDDDDDEFGCNDIDEASLAQAEFSATQAFRASLSNSNVSNVGSR